MGLLVATAQVGLSLHVLADLLEGWDFVLLLILQESGHDLVGRGLVGAVENLHLGGQGIWHPEKKVETRGETCLGPLPCCIQGLRCKSPS